MTCGKELATIILEQMRQGKQYWNMLDDIYGGTSTTYFYANGSFCRQEIDNIVGAFSNETPMTEEEMLNFIAEQNVIALEQSGFSFPR